jgi:hypothetical protein
VFGVESGKMFAIGDQFTKHYCEIAEDEFMKEIKLPEGA